jgi:hypothetical protein
MSSVRTMHLGRGSRLWLSEVSRRLVGCGGKSVGSLGRLEKVDNRARKDGYHWEEV